MEIRNKIREYMNELTKNWVFSGSLLIAKQGDIIYQDSYGMADYEHQVPNKKDTKFRIYSMTKSFTAIAIMLLQEDGKLGIEAKANEFLPAEIQIDERVTIHHLLTHTSGVFDYSNIFDSEKRLYRQPLSRKDIIDLFIDKPLEFEPGSHWAYSNSGYYLLGLVIEQVSGLSYKEFLKERIFKVVGMNNTGLDDVDQIIPNRARGYYINGEELINCEFVDTCALYADGGLYSTVEDLYRFDQALYTEKLLKRVSLEKLFTPYLGDYGYGWFIEEPFNHKRISHGGGYKGFLAELHRYVDDEVTIILLTNLGFSYVFQICEDLAKIIFNEPVKLPTKPQAFVLDPKIFENYMGEYKSQFEHVLVTRNNNEYFFILNHKYKIPMYPISETVFHSTWAREAYGYRKDEDGNEYFFGCKKIK